MVIDCMYMFLQAFSERWNLEIIDLRKREVVEDLVGADREETAGTIFYMREECIFNKPEESLNLEYTLIFEGIMHDIY